MLRLQQLQIRFKLKHTDGAYQLYIPWGSQLDPHTEIIQLRQAEEFIFELNVDPNHFITANYKNYIKDYYLLF